MSLHRHAHHARRALLLAAAATLAGCASDPAPRPWTEIASRDLHLSLTSVDVLGRRVGVTRSTLASGAPPVVVYLPGLGQGSDAGQRWAAAWAQAGYAVLTVQPLDDDQQAWRSALARTGEFRELGLRHYGDEMRAQRLAALRRLLPALKAAQPTLDWSHTALAGYETGAQTALDARGDAGWQAVIAISPPVMSAPATGAAALLVTSELDSDPLGLAASAAQRQQAFESFAPGSGWLLTLRQASHAGLAGTLAPDGWHAQDQHVEMTRAIRAGGGGGGGGGGNRRGEGGGGSAAQPSMYVGPRSGSASEAANAQITDALRDTTAFLDAQLRGKPLNAPQLKAR